MSKRTIIIDTDNNTIDLLRNGYNIIERSVYDEDIVKQLKDMLNTVVFDDNIFEVKENV